MLDISRKTFERNGIETIIGNDGILWLNEKHIGEGLEHKHFWEIKIKDNSHQRKPRYELLEEPKTQINWIFIDKKSAIKVITDRRLARAHEFRTRLGFK